jgi:hypothetical protein
MDDYTVIPHNTGDDDWSCLNIGVYVWYGEAKKVVYGSLCNWYTVNSSNYDQAGVNQTRTGWKP